MASDMTVKDREPDVDDSTAELDGTDATSDSTSGSAEAGSLRTRGSPMTCCSSAQATTSPRNAPTGHVKRTT